MITHVHIWHSFLQVNHAVQRRTRSRRRAAGYRRRPPCSPRGRGPGRRRGAGGRPHSEQVLDVLIMGRAGNRRCCCASCRGGARAVQPQEVILQVAAAPASCRGCRCRRRRPRCPRCAAAKAQEVLLLPSGTAGRRGRCRGGAAIKAKKVSICLDPRRRRLCRWCGGSSRCITWPPTAGCRLWRHRGLGLWIQHPPAGVPGPHARGGPRRRCRLRRPRWRRRRWAAVLKLLLLLLALVVPTLPAATTTVPRLLASRLWIAGVPTAVLGPRLLLHVPLAQRRLVHNALQGRRCVAGRTVSQGGSSCCSTLLRCAALLCTARGCPIK